MLISQSFDFLVKTFKEKQTQQEASNVSLETSYKRKRLECCSDRCRTEQLCQEIYSHGPYREIVTRYFV